MHFICLPCRVHQGVLFVAVSLWLHSSGFGPPPSRSMQSEAEVSQRSARGIEPLRQRYILIQPYPSADIDEDLTLAAMTSVALGVPFGS